MNEPKHKYGTLAPIYLTDQEYQNLNKKYPHMIGDEIERLSEYIAQTGKEYQSHYATLLKWCREDFSKYEHKQIGVQDQETREAKNRYGQMINDLKERKKTASAEEAKSIDYRIISIEDCIKRINK